MKILFYFSKQRAAYELLETRYNKNITQKKGLNNMASMRKRNNSYQITVSNGRDSSGKQIVETATFILDNTKTERQNRKDAEKFAYDFEQKVRSGKYLSGEKLSFQEFTEIWFEDYANIHLVKKTLLLYNNLLDRHILPVIGHLKLSKILPVHLNKLYNTLSHERKDGKPGGYSAKTLKHIHNLINNIFTAAIKWNVATDNPCERVSTPKLTPTCDKLKFFTLEEAQLFLKLIDEPNDYDTQLGHMQFQLFYHLAIFCGLRKGEIVALEWSDLNFIENSVSITKSTSMVNGEMITKKPKTNSSIRKLSVPVSVMQLAKEYRKEQLQHKLSLGSDWQGQNYIFIQWNGQQMHPHTPYKKFKKIIKRYNKTVTDEKDKLPDIPLHGLRHTSATLLISQNVDIKTVSTRLGHSQASTTIDIYTHALKQLDKKAADTLDNLLIKA